MPQYITQAFAVQSQQQPTDTVMTKVTFDEKDVKNVLSNKGTLNSSKSRRVNVLLVLHELGCWFRMLSCSCPAMPVPVEMSITWHVAMRMREVIEVLIEILEYYMTLPLGTC